MIPMLHEGLLDAALVSSIEAFRRPGYRALADIGIASAGPIGSVRAFRRPGPLVRVGLDQASETSVVLLKILLHRVLDAPSCTFERIDPTRDLDSLPHDLVLLIGDRGLHAQTFQRTALDLGQAWWQFTGLPFVFALWLLAPSADSHAIADRLRLARARAGDPPPEMQGTTLRYDLGAAELTGLLRFAAEAVQLGLAQPGVAPQWLHKPSDSN